MKNNLSEIDLSIIIVSYNTKDLTTDCINSIIRHTKDLNYEIIVIDNHSTDGSVKEINNLKLKIKNLRIIQNNENFGYAKANNRGIQEAKGKIILLLNSDTKIENDGTLEEAIDNLKTADVLTINVKSPNGENQQAAGYGPTLLNLFFWAFFLDDLPLLRNLVKPYQVSNLDFFNEDHWVDWVIGAFFLAKRKVFERVGGLDEKIFMYGEEMEFCRRAREKGFQVKYFSTPSIVHLGMGSAESADGAIIGEYKALKYFFEKHEPRWKNYVLNAIIRSSIILRIVVFNLVNSSKAKNYEKAYRQI